MKFKFTPLLIISLGLILVGLFYMFSGVGGNLGPLAGMLLIAVGLVSLLPYFILRKVFNTNTKAQLIAELALVVVILFVLSISKEKVVLHVPRNYKGYIVITYEAAGKPKFTAANWFDRDVNLTVPPSGLIYTSDKKVKAIVVVDSSRSLQEVPPGYGIPFSDDTLICSDKKHPLDILVIGKLPPDWEYATDTVARGLKKGLACKLLSE